MSASRYDVVAEASAAGILFPLCLIAGYWMGKRVGSLWGAGTAAALVGAALGAAAAFWNLVRLLRRLEDGRDRRP